MERKEFIKTSCNACLLMAAGYFLPILSGCSPKLAVFKTAVIDKKLTVPLTMFNTTSLRLVRPAGWLYDIAVEKKQDGSYAALLLQCTHQDNQLTADGDGFHCNLHGSQFDKDGRVRKGPAERALESYQTAIDRDQLIIQISKIPQS